MGKQTPAAADSTDVDSPHTQSRPRARPFRLALFGAFGCGNFGNDATLAACLGAIALRVPLASVLCVAVNPARVESAYGLPAVPFSVPPSLAGGGGRLLGRTRRAWGELRNLWLAWRVLRGVGTLVIAGTGVLDDQHVRPTQLPLDVFRWSLAARLAGTQLVFVSVGAGPITQRWSRVLLKAAVGLAHDVSYRDERSLDYMRNLGRNVESDRVVPDLAFATSASTIPVRNRDVVPHRIAIGVLGKLNWKMRMDMYRQYEDRLVHLITRLTAGGWEVHLLNGDESDVDTQRAVCGRRELAGLHVVVDQTHSFADVLAVLATCEAMVASRYHNIVAAVLLGIPVVSLGYGPKNAALLEQLAATAFAHDIDDFDVDIVIKQIAEATRDTRARYVHDLASYRHTLDHEFEILTDASR